MMKTLQIQILLALALLTCAGLFAQSATKGQLTIKVANIKSTEGKILVGLYDSEDNWLEKIYMGGTGLIANGKSEIVLKNIPFGTYAVSLFHDENDNNKLDMRFGFFPKEPNACSNQAPAVFGPPRWKDAKFTLKATTKTIIIKL
ncbi:MAG: DUF2141 domain-containing protein [Bacteroidota bacterium]